MEPVLPRFPDSIQLYKLTLNVTFLFNGNLLGIRKPQKPLVSKPLVCSIGLNEDLRGDSVHQEVSARVFIIIDPRGMKCLLWEDNAGEADRFTELLTHI